MGVGVGSGCGVVWSGGLWGLVRWELLGGWGWAVGVWGG